MNESEYTKLFIEISSKLASIDTKMTTLCSTIAGHEQRICNLEKGHINTKDEDFKSQLIQLLAKSLIIGMTTIASLVGAGSLLSKMF